MKMSKQRLDHYLLTTWRLYAAKAVDAKDEKVRREYYEAAELILKLREYSCGSD